MEKTTWAIVVLGIASLFSPALSSDVVANLKRSLLNDNKYDEYVRMTPPQESPEKELNVSFGINLIAIQDFDTDSGIGRFHIWEKNMWNDRRLTWRPRDYDDVDTIRVPPDSVWKPDMKLFTSRNVPELIDMSALVVVKSDGTVIWIPPTERIIKCKNDEGQRWSCVFKYGSWTYDSSILNVDFYNMQKAIDMADFTLPDVPEVKVISSDAVRHAKKYACCEETYVDLTFTLVFDVIGSGRSGAVQAGFSGALFSITLAIMAMLKM